LDRENIDQRGTSTLERVHRGLNELGYREFMRRYLRYLTITRLHKGVLRRLSWPSMEELLSDDRAVHTEAGPLLGALLSVEQGELHTLQEEFEKLAWEVDARRERLPTRLSWSIERSTAQMLYILVRLVRPEVVLETGVADGNSTVYILRALALNGSGDLVSTDVLPDVGRLLSDDERRCWHFHHLSPRQPEADFLRLLEDLSHIDVFFHDSDHTYGGQMSQYLAAESKLAAGGFIISDDVDYSYAFMDYCKRSRSQPRFLVDRRKVMGVVQPRPSVARQVIERTP